MWVKVLEENLESSSIIYEWLTHQPTEGILRLLSSQDFYCEAEDEEAEILAKLLDLRDRIDLKSGATEHRQVIKKTIEDVIEYFYGNDCF